MTVLSKIMQEHAVPVLSENQNLDKSLMSDVHDSPAWQRAYAANGVFGGDPRGVSTQLCTDGVNPFCC